MLPLYGRTARAVLAISQAALDDLARHGLKLPRALVTDAGVGPRFTPTADPGELRRFREEDPTAAHTAAAGRSRRDEIRRLKGASCAASADSTGPMSV